MFGAPIPARKQWSDPIRDPGVIRVRAFALHGMTETCAELARCGFSRRRLGNPRADSCFQENLEGMIRSFFLHHEITAAPSTNKQTNKQRPQLAC